MCQYRLGRLLYEGSNRRERDYVQAVALFELAEEQGIAEAKRLAGQESARLTEEQRKWVASIKQQIVRK
jgi:TPR repeat protein